MRVLLIEDDKSFAKSVELILRSEHIEVVSSEMGDDGVLLSKLFYDLIVLDLELPDMTGLEVLASLRGANIKTPVLILTGNAMLESKVAALGFGADDYMTKPFHKDELVARIRAIVRRSKGQSRSFDTSGSLIVNLTGKTVEIEGVRSHLTDREYQRLFQALVPFILPSQRASFEVVGAS